MRRFDTDKYYAPGDAEMRLIATRGTLAVWRCEGRGPQYTKFGHRVVYLGRDLNDWLDAHVIDPTPQPSDEPAGVPA